MCLNWRAHPPTRACTGEHTPTHVPSLGTPTHSAVAGVHIHPSMLSSLLTGLSPTAHVCPRASHRPPVTRNPQACRINATQHPRAQSPGSISEIVLFSPTRGRFDPQRALHVCVRSAATDPVDNFCPRDKCGHLAGALPRGINATSLFAANFECSDRCNCRQLRGCCRLLVECF